DSKFLPSRVLHEGRVPREAGNGVVTGGPAFQHDDQPLSVQQRHKINGRRCLDRAGLLG
ncbi:hypothetical protein M9458_029026, partial [Cirrhinus mrigala]